VFWTAVTGQSTTNHTDTEVIIMRKILLIAAVLAAIAAAYVGYRVAHTTERVTDANTAAIEAADAWFESH
jgi:hypothetical protein